jgi:sRNA-binding carbon storage regulator CsrA
MLVLKRKKNTAITTNTGLRLEVVEIGQAKAYLVVTHPAGSFGLWLGVGESVRVDGAIEIGVCSIEMGAIKIGIEAPAEVEVMREELLNLPDGVLLGTIWANR